MSYALDQYKQRFQTTIEGVQSMEELRKDTMIDFVYRMGRSLFDKDLDQTSEDWLVRHGAKLSGASAYLGNITTRARAERDVAKVTIDQLSSQMLLDSDEEKVTLAKAKVNQAMVDVHSQLIYAEAKKNDMEQIMKATETMISFIQTAIRVKGNEHYRSKQTQV